MLWLLTSIRLVVATFLVCVVAYTSIVLVAATLVAPGAARASLIAAPDGTAIGSRLVAQRFMEPRYFWSRPSAVDYDASAAGGSNKSPASSALTDRARDMIVRHDAMNERPLPADLAAASGSGLDPHITERAALYQVRRVAQARGLPPRLVEELIRERAFSPGGVFTVDRVINVLELNLALDTLSGHDGHSQRAEASRP